MSELFDAVDALVASRATTPPEERKRLRKAHGLNRRRGRHGTARRPRLGERLGSRRDGAASAGTRRLRTQASSANSPSCTRPTPDMSRRPSRPGPALTVPRGPSSSSASCVQNTSALPPTPGTAPAPPAHRHRPAPPWLRRQCSRLRPARQPTSFRSRRPAGPAPAERSSGADTRFENEDLAVLDAEDGQVFAPGVC
jgi:hypothetical protein